MPIPSVAHFLRTQSSGPYDWTATDEKVFFGSLKMPNGTFKTTESFRMVDCDIKLSQLAATRYESAEISLLDIGISSGKTTLDLDKQLTDAAVAHRIYGVDLYVDAVVTRTSEGEDVLSLAGTDHVLLASRGQNPSHRPWHSRKDWVTLRPLRMHSTSQRWRKIAAEKQGVERIAVKLISPLVTHAKTNIEFLQGDIFDLKLSGPFDVIRAMNILNIAYFPRIQILLGLTGLVKKLPAQGGLLLVGRHTAEGELLATIFDIHQKRTAVERLGSGSEVEDVVFEAIKTDGRFAISSS